MRPVTESSEPATPTERPPTTQRTRLRLGAVLAVGLAGAFLAWVLVDRDDDEAVRGMSPPIAETTPPDTTGTVAAPAVEPILVDPDQLRGLAARNAIPVYWAGRRAGTSIEVSSRTDGTFYVRYLPPGVPPGDEGPALTVATYPRANGFAEVRRAARKGTKTMRLPGGGLAVYGSGDSRNVHLAYPGEPYQVEVFSPRLDAARALVASGAVQPLR
jgi:hypothetical protein